jgi:hypothetical protein
MPDVAELKVSCTQLFIFYVLRNSERSDAVNLNNEGLGRFIYFFSQIFSDVRIYPFEFL